MVFLSKEQVLELFKNSFEIIEFNEVEKDGKTGLGKMKHWHIYNVIAKKKWDSRIRVISSYNHPDNLQFIIKIICKLIIFFPLNGMGVPIVEFVWEYKFSAG